MYRGVVAGCIQNITRSMSLSTCRGFRGGGIHLYLFPLFLPLFYPYKRSSHDMDVVVENFI